MSKDLERFKLWLQGGVTAALIAAVLAIGEPKLTYFTFGSITTYWLSPNRPN